jgi:hypothetical protein
MRGFKRRSVDALIVSVLLAAAMPRVAATAETFKPLSKAASGLVAADTARYQAMVGRDVKALELLLADELVYIHSSSTRQSKSEHLHDIEMGSAVYKRIDTKEQVPSIYGNTGLIQGVAIFTTGGGGREITFTLRYTSVYVRRQGRWQMVSFSCSRIPEAGAAAPRAEAPSAGGPPGAAPSGPLPGSPPQT